jgi:uncharacterized protein with FMN-binding domain
VKRVIPVLVLSVAGLIPVWRYEPSIGGTTASTTEPVTSPSASASSGTVVKGTLINTSKGPLQVQVTFDGDKITAVKTLQQPDHPQTEAAVPKLIAETLTAQSADIDTVTGATITSDAYKDSLQAAIDVAAKAASASPSATASTSASTAPSKQTVAGTLVNTSKGPVQVQVTFEGDKISAVSMLQQPNHPQTTAAVPVLIEETLKAQSSKIDTVSGATITSGAYVQSLQAAIDAKGA